MKFRICLTITIVCSMLFCSSNLHGKAIKAGRRRAARARQAAKDDALTEEKLQAFEKAYEHYSNGDDHFQQVTPSFTDPVGDAALVWKLKRVAGKIVDAIFKRAKGDEGDGEKTEMDEDENLENEEELPESSDDAFCDLLYTGETEEPSETPTEMLENHQEADYRVTSEGLIISKVKPLNIGQLINKCHQIMEKHYPEIVPFTGAPHRWSAPTIKYFRERSGKSYNAKKPHRNRAGGRPLFRTKLFACLACGWTSRYMITGHEENLLSWIMEQDDKSIEIHELFETCYLMNKGDIYMALLTAENVLAGDPYRDDRQSDPLQKKLAYIRNDSVEKGDNYGSWYHFFGIALYGSCRGPLTSRLVARIETLGSIFLEDRDPQENYMNNLGAAFGDKLERLVHELTEYEEETGEFMSLPNGANTDYRQYDPKFLKETGAGE